MKNTLVLPVFLLVIAVHVLGGSLSARSFDVRVVGQGAPLVLIPGLTCSGAVWDATVQHLEENYTCHVVTIAGFAGVPAQEDNRKAFLATVLSDLGNYIHDLPAPVSVIGHSIGGYMGMALAARHPDRVERLVVVDSYPQLAGFMSGPEVDYDLLEGQLAASRPFLLSLPDSVYAANQRQNMRLGIRDSLHAAEVAQWGIDSDRATMLQAYEEVLLADLRPELPAITCPTLVLQSYNSLDWDAAAWQALNDRQYGGLRGVQIERSDAGGHFLMYDVSDWYHQQLNAFLL